MITPAVSSLARRAMRLLGLLVLCKFVAVSAVFAASDDKLHFDVPAGEANTTLKQFATQAKREIMFQAEPVNGVKTNAVHGEMTVSEALGLLLAGTGLQAIEDEKSGALMVKRESSANAAKTTENASPVDPPPAAAPPPAKSNDSYVALDPFEVKTNRDTSYGALNSNSIVRFNVELDKVPITADILTHQFIEDTQVRSVEELFAQYAAGAGEAFITPTDANNSQPGDRFSEGQFVLRGLPAGVARRDGFATGQMSTTNQNSTNVFDVERLDILEGSQGLLYGATGAGGVVNVVSKQAEFNVNKGEVQHRIDQYGSHTTMFDGNAGQGWAAARFVAIHDANQTRRVFIGDVTNGYYAQLAFRLPLHTTLRLANEKTNNIRYIPTNQKVNFNGSPAASDPRNGYTLPFLYLTHQLGAINPATGQPFPGGAIDNGNLTRDNLYSLLGWHTQDLVNTTVWEATVDTVWAPWLSTSAGVYWNKQTQMRDPNGSDLFAPGATGNTTGDWAVAPTYSDSEGPNRQRSYRANALTTFDLFDGKAHTQTAIGFDRAYQDSNSVVYKYYLQNAAGGVPVDPTQVRLGRGTALAGSATVWSVGQGPIRYAGAKPGAIFLDVNGQRWVRMPANPTNKAWVTPGNPEGLASLYQPTIGVTSGLDKSENELPWALQERDQGFYAANYTNWFHDRLETLMGFRESDVFTRVPNTSLPPPTPDWQETRSGSLPSYNAGFIARLLPLPGDGWLRAFYGYSRTFNVAFIGGGNSDPYGTLVPNPVGYTHEVGLKFNAFHDKLSGSLSAYIAYSTNDAFNGGGTFSSVVNPTGLNGQFLGNTGQPASFAVYDKVSRGLQLILTAEPVSNWRTRFSATISDGTVRSNASYKTLYNDEFFLDKTTGNVTYGKGGPVVMVPSDTASLALLAKQASAVDMSNPAATSYKSSTLVPLTINMINDPTNAYYAFGGTGKTFSGTAFNPANQPLNGSIASGTGTPYLKNALSFFQSGNATPLTGRTGLPSSAMQYAFADPGGFQGTYVVLKKGEVTVGYPVFNLNLTNDYRFSQGWIKGFHLGASVALSWDYRTYYYATSDRVRHLFSAAEENPLVNSWFGYSRKFRYFTWSTQLNIKNMFNRYQLEFTPSNGTGFANALNIGVRWDGEPRTYSWTNTIDF